MDEHFILAHFYLGLTYAQQKRFDEASAELQRALTLAGRGALLQAGLGYAYAAAGRREEALQLLAQLQTFPLNRDVSPFCLALIYAGLGEHEQALKFLEDAYEERFSWMVWLKHEPIFEALRTDERFVALMRRMGLTQ
jgi:tetratricopeptide (TPR) repeat protein